MRRIVDHPILGTLEEAELLTITVDGEDVMARKGEVIAAALMAHNKSVFRYTNKRREPRNLFCGIGRCTDCVMIVDGVPNVRTCLTTVQPGMVIETQEGSGHWGKTDDRS